MAKKFIDDNINHIESDIEKIQTRTGMYISYLGEDGAVHLAKEVINNMVDECINPNSPATNITIHLDETENTLTVSDNGRGIPFDKLELICTKLQSGSKFTRENVGNSAGENGVGLTAVNALSDHFEIISKRHGERARISFQRGDNMKLDVRKIDNSTHGTTFIYQPSAHFLGTCPISTEKLLMWLEKLVYMLPPDIQIKFDVVKKGKEASISKKFRNKNGMYDYVKKKLAEEPILDPVHLTDVTKLVEESRGKTYDRYAGLEVAFTFNSTPDDIVADSFCNFINTVEHGTHYDAVLSTLTTFILKEARSSLSAKAAKTLTLIPKDVHQGLVLALYLSTDMEPHFASQTKEKLASEKFSKPLSNMFKDLLTEHFRVNPKDLKKIVEYVKRNAKARLEATKARATVVKTARTSIDQFKIKNFNAANDKGRREYRELLLIEGDSAAGSANQARFKRFQATYGLRGVPLNSFDKKASDAMKNVELRQLVSILGCGIGDGFDLKKCLYDKIIIMADSDIDGFRIMSLICAFFIRHMPEVVEDGRLYKAVAPLYRIKDSKREFVLNKHEFIQVYEERIGDNIKLTNPTTGKTMTHRQLQDFLLINRDYFETLDRVAKHYSTHRHLMEFVARFYDKDTLDLKQFNEKLQQRFPEMKLDSDNVLSGIYENKFQQLVIDRLVIRRLDDIKHILDQQDVNDHEWEMKERYGTKYNSQGVKTLCELMERFQKFQPEIVTRFKGVGELDPDQLGDTTLDPNNRILIQLTMADLEKELAKFNILHGKSSEERKTLLENFKIKREDLDN